MTYFTESQRFTQPWLWALLLVVTGYLSFGAYRQLIQGDPWGSNPASDGVLFATWSLFAVGLPALFAFARLRTEVTDDGVRLRFAPFHRRPRFWAHEEIASVTARTYSPLREFGGWGIRIGAYNVTGNRGVELRFRSGARLLIGSQDADALATALERARTDRSAAASR